VTMPGIRLCSPAINCPNALELAGFYAEITGGRIAYSDEVWATMVAPSGRLDFQTDPAYVPPTWPDRAVPIQMHLDFDVDDLVAAESQVLAAGATKYADQPNADHCLVFADPAGNRITLHHRYGPHG